MKWGNGPVVVKVIVANVSGVVEVKGKNAPDVMKMNAANNLRRAKVPRWIWCLCHYFTLTHVLSLSFPDCTFVLGPTRRLISDILYTY